MTASRLLLFASTLILFGSSLFFLYGFDADGVNSIATRDGWARHLVLGVAVVALAAAILWLLAETAALTGAASEAFRWSALSSVVLDTRFGRIAALRAAALALSLAVQLITRRSGKPLWIVQVGIAAAVVASFAWTGHGTMDEGLAGVVHLSSDLLHLFSAGVWVGALVPLSFLLLRTLRPGAERFTPMIANALARFSGIGIVVVSILLLSGLINSVFLIQSAPWRAVVSTRYGRLLAAKIALFVLMLSLAAVNRYRFAPQLNAELTLSSATPGALRGLRAALITETVLALLVLGVVAELGTLEPPRGHTDQAYL